MVPRPRLNGELAHKHIVTLSNTTGNSNERLLMQYVSGQTQFVSGPDPVTGGFVTSPNMSISWSLAQMEIRLGGAAAINIPVPNTAELQALYDTFQIEKVDVTIFFGNNMSLVTADTTAGYNWVLPLIGYAPDTDDNGNASFTALQQYSTFKVHQSASPLKKSLVPCPALQTSDAAGSFASGGYTRAQKLDIDCSYPDTPHNALKLSVDGLMGAPTGQNGAIGVLSVQSRIHFIMKGTR